MKNLFIEILLALVFFGLFKLLLVGIYKFIDKKCNCSSEGKRKFDLFGSCSMISVFVFMWLFSMEKVLVKFPLTDLEIYISFIVIGVICVIWCYFSWDAERILVKPCVATREERRIKRIIIYVLITIFVLVQGYYQTLHVMNPKYEIDKLFSIANNSVIVAVIALDRVMNQIFNK